jgi:hypothetical protein
MHAAEEEAGTVTFPARVTETDSEKAACDRTETCDYGVPGRLSRGAALSVQRLVNESTGFTAILPGPTLQEVWDIVGAVEDAAGGFRPRGRRRACSRAAHAWNEAQEMAILRSVALGPMYLG